MVVEKGDNMPWYHGSTLLHTLETIHISSDRNMIDCRFPVQTVLRPHKEEFHDFRGYAGRIESGIFKKGDEVLVLPSGYTSKVDAVYLDEEEVEEAFPPMSVTITLEDDIDISRGDMLVRPHNQPESTQDVEVMMCWMGTEPLNPNKKFTLIQTTNQVKCLIKEVRYKVDINSLHRNEEDLNIQMNDIARMKIRTTKPLLVDSYNKNRSTGSVILVDEATNNTVGAGMII
jgi:sulfate adenylyltransferase subunit 1